MATTTKGEVDRKKEVGEREAEGGGDEEGEVQTESKSKMRQRHRNELKELRVKIEGMQRGVSKQDKKGKADLQIKIKQMEDEIQKRHAAEEKDFIATDEKEEEPTMSNTITLAPNTNKKPSKKQLKKNKQLQQEHNRIKAIEEENKNTVSYRTLENNALSEKLAPLGLTIKEIPPDGNCLYNAVVDQISLHSRLSDKGNHVILRQRAADYILAHPDDYLPFLQVEDGDGIASMKDLEKYCDELRNTNNWGGQLEIIALCHVFTTPITVHSANQPDVVMGEEYSTKNKPFHLSYHKHAYALGEHYNSVVFAPVGEDDDE